MMPRHADDRGFTFVEALIALVILLVAMGTLLQVAASGQRLARTNGEATDLHQRVRVAAEKLHADLALAGSGPMKGLRASLSGGLTGFIAPIVPARTGTRSPDPPLSAFSDRLSIIYVTEGAWPSSLTVDMAAASDAVPTSGAAPGCPVAGHCGFLDGTRALIVDTSNVGAGHDLFTVTGTAGELAHDPPNPPLHRPYSAANAVVVPVVQRVYHFDRANRRLMLYDGHLTDMPLVDNVVDVRFTYFADPRPSSVSRPADALGSCVYDPGSPPIPRLDDFGGDRLHELTSLEMSDGPACGGGLGTFDGDLLRIRLVRVTLRLEAAADDVRGAGALFRRAGRSSSAYSYVPDHEVTFDVAPRNMAPAVLPR